jgi:hypothetical protein
MGTQNRRGWDSNPRYPDRVQLLSREPDSTALAPLPIAYLFERPNLFCRNAESLLLVNCPRICALHRINVAFHPGEGGIRTPGTLRLNGFQDRLLRPLGHLSSDTSICKTHKTILRATKIVNKYAMGGSPGRTNRNTEVIIIPHQR